ncbi:MAG: pyridoxamine 5'-phosphate oxidase family protein [Desulfobacula sp.]|uniref:pyridoxamine 5'-phosphate oxidase family protein n=1 Tax=Desulfobacula sp. TaxID=2593537 RepID=UPI0025BD1199|nr:pyridoxamine 5'-phosphate oxidase family protein [Desulfobacula sp.]MCD4722168.1 pyridoxamine 5'-phosphate oxidase family protein [Desulfobacula sp.]
MPALPETVLKAWKDHQGPIILTTVDEDGLPNAIYATCVSLYSNDTVVVANNYFDKTKNNILNGSKGSFLFITSENKSYQLKGYFDYLTSGEIYDDMKQWNPEKHPGHAAVALRIEAAYSGAEKLL